ncbi:hypothetical protein EAS64_04835 [Trebonia kvetii]|uniref:Uncharacterized protein n=1 Tax=Trebonia kvetii TaxID=2480626 RepID=A0A6P2C699_9ACTN|nr:hypothetical protein [Trebonia kvetii]TVZ06700.1 hypothetical protein EAS64_04835 [Trebonia kvetii]
MRTENDLMAALRTLEPADPDEAAVLRGVRRRIARRRILLAGGLTGVTGVAATVTAVAVLAGSAPGPGSAAGGQHPRVTPAASGPQPSTSQTVTGKARTAAYIVRHAAAAEAAAARMIQVTRNGAGVSYLSVATQQELFVSSRRIPGGRPLMATAESISGETYTSTEVDYKDRAYNVVSASTRDASPWGAKGIVIGSWLPGVTASDPASAYNDALRKGIIKVVGYRKLHGRQTILIRIDYRKAYDSAIKPHPCITGQDGACLPPRPAGCKLPPPGVNEVWLDASTFLEVQEATLAAKTVMYTVDKPGIQWACYTVTGWSTDATSVDWLPPTRQNLALLNLKPPAGFAQVSSQQMAQYLGPYS